MPSDMTLLPDDEEEQDYSEHQILWTNINPQPDLTAARFRRPWFFLPLSVSIASFGGILFGYDIGIISGAILLIRKEFYLSCFQQELIVTFLIIGALISSFVGGSLLDHFGRKRTIIFNAFLFLFGALILSFSNSFPIFLVGRLILGFAVALSAVGDCVYISEIAPPKKRGLLVSLNELGVTLGILLAYLVNFFMINSPNGWRYMFGLSAIPAFMQAFGMVFLPYSPRWLVLKGDHEEAEKVISTLWPDLNSRLEVSRLKTSLSREGNFRIWDLFSKKDNMRMRMLMGCGIILFQQLTGQPTVLYYAPVLFKTLGFNENTSATLATIGLGAVKVVFTMGTLLSVDKLGRRTFLLLGAAIMTIGLVALSALTEPFHDLSRTHKPCQDVVGTHQLHHHLLDVNTNTSECTRNQTLLEAYPTMKAILQKLNTSEKSNNENNIGGNNQRIENYSHMNHIHNNSSHCRDAYNKKKKEEEVETKEGLIPSAVKYTSLAALMLFVIGYAVGYGPMSWLLLSEIFPTAIKGRAVSVATSVNWGTNILLSMTFLDVIGTFGPFYTFLMYSLIGVTSIIFLYHFVPETKGKSLEDISFELNKKSISCNKVRCCSEVRTVYVEKDESDILLTDNNDFSSYEVTEHIM